MTVRPDGDVVVLEGECRVEEAEPLAVLLQASPTRRVQVAGCSGMHAAVLQVLLTFAAKVEGEPSNPFLKEMVATNWLPNSTGQA